MYNKPNRSLRLSSDMWFSVQVCVILIVPEV